VLFLAYGPEAARPFELNTMIRRGLAAIPDDVVEAEPEASARRALDALHARRILVHFDVDAIDFNDAQLSEDAVRGDGLTLDAAIRALGVLCADERFAALTVTELNPDHGDEQGAELRRFVDGLAGALAA
jgi:arginase